VFANLLIAAPHISEGRVKLTKNLRHGDIRAFFSLLSSVSVPGCSSILKDEDEVSGDVQGVEFVRETSLKKKDSSGLGERAGLGGTMGVLSLNVNKWKEK
jgi:hypothetical protein